jgi:hypothetical protein
MSSGSFRANTQEPKRGELRCFLFLIQYRYLIKITKSTYGSLTMWSKELIKLSREYFNCGNTSVKSQNGGFGILNIDYRACPKTVRVGAQSIDLFKNLLNVGKSPRVLEQVLQNASHFAFFQRKLFRN